MDHPTRPDNFTGLWIDRHGEDARTEQYYVGGVANGAHRSILDNGVVHCEGFKKDGLWHGKMILRNSQGAVLDESEFVEGTGVYRIFNTAGQMTDEVAGRTVRVRVHSSTSPRRGRPPGVAGASVFSFVGATPPDSLAAWKFEGNTTRTRIDITFDAGIAPGAIVWLCAFWFNPRALSGPASEPVSTRVPGGLTSEAA